MLLKKLIFFLISVNLFVMNCYGFVEVFVGAGAIVVALIGTLSYFRGESCTKHMIPARFNDLQLSLNSKVFGQPLVHNTISHALRRHWNDANEPRKALALSFHGGTGVGKNYVSKFIQESLYLKGAKSSHVHHFVAGLHFPEENEINLYKKNLANWIRGNVSRCSKQLFIFDEVNQMPWGLLDVIKPFFHQVAYKETIFIFLSNTGASLINERAYYLWKKGIDRSQMGLHYFENLIVTGAFNEDGGFQYSDELIDHYIIFLPLMKPHIESCIRKEFEKHGYFHPSEASIREVLDSIGWDPDLEKVFAKTGCKRISQRVALLV